MTSFDASFRSSGKSESDPPEANPDAPVGSPGKPSAFRTEAPAADHILTASIGSTAQDVRDALIGINGELKRQGVPSQDRDAIEVVLAECMNNVVEHAYSERPGCRFELKLRLSADNLYCRVEDDGRPMPGLVLPGGKTHNLDVDLSDLPEGGFGWFLIRELTCDLKYARERDRNNLMFQIPLSHGEG